MNIIEAMMVKYQIMIDIARFHYMATHIIVMKQRPIETKFRYSFNKVHRPTTR